MAKPHDKTCKTWYLYKDINYHFLYLYISATSCTSCREVLPRDVGTLTTSRTSCHGFLNKLGDPTVSAHRLRVHPFNGAGLLLTESIKLHLTRNSDPENRLHPRPPQGPTCGPTTDRPEADRLAHRRSNRKQKAFAGGSEPFFYF